MFNGCMDTEGIEAAGLTRILNQVGASGTYGGWPMIQDSRTAESILYNTNKSKLMTLAKV